MTTDKNNSPVTAPMWWDGGDRAITAREKATIEEHGPSCFSIGLVPATPSARWAADGLPDPHAGRYACERAALTLGNLTDDELANAVYLHGNEQPSMADLVAGKALSGIVYLTAAKERIRWLSRALTGATAPQPAEMAEQKGVGRRNPLEIAAILRAMSINYAHGHVWDHLDAEVCQEAADSLAARQPGAQEHVAVVGPDFTLLWAGSGPIAPIVERHGLKRGSLLYAAPPVQGIDLGQMVVSETTDETDAEWLCRKARAEGWNAYRDALIGQRDASPGVSRG